MVDVLVQYTGFVYLGKGIIESIIWWLGLVLVLLILFKLVQNGIIRWSVSFGPAFPIFGVFGVVHNSSVPCDSNS